MGNNISKAIAIVALGIFIIFQIFINVYYGYFSSVYIMSSIAMVLLVTFLSIQLFKDKPKESKIAKIILVVACILIAITSLYKIYHLSIYLAYSFLHWTFVHSPVEIQFSLFYIIYLLALLGIIIYGIFFKNKKRYLNMVVITAGVYFVINMVIYFSLVLYYLLWLQSSINEDITKIISILFMTSYLVIAGGICATKQKSRLGLRVLQIALICRIVFGLYDVIVFSYYPISKLMIIINLIVMTMFVVAINMKIRSNEIK